MEALEGLHSIGVGVNSALQCGGVGVNSAFHGEGILGHGLFDREED